MPRNESPKVTSGTTSGIALVRNIQRWIGVLAIFALGIVTTEYHPNHASSRTARTIRVAHTTSPGSRVDRDDESATLANTTPEPSVNEGVAPALAHLPTRRAAANRRRRSQNRPYGST